MAQTQLHSYNVKRYGEHKVALKMAQIIKEINIQNTDIKKMQNAQDSTGKRLDVLVEKNLNLEYMMLGGQLVEQGLKRLIKTVVFTINSHSILSDFNTDIWIQEDIGGLTLGLLHKKIKSLYKIDSKLSSTLGDFIIKRNDCVHKIYDKFQDVEKVNENIKSYVNKNPVKDLCKGMAELHGILLDKLTKNLIENGCEPTPT